MLLVKPTALFSCLALIVSNLPHSLALFVFSALFVRPLLVVLSADAALNAAPSNGWFGGRSGLALVVKGNKKSGKQLFTSV